AAAPGAGGIRRLSEPPIAPVRLVVEQALYLSQPDWVQWQQLYENPEQVVAQRLVIVQRLIREFLAARAGDKVSVVSVCAGQGRDILGVLADHPDRGYLVELNPTNTAQAV